MPRRTLLIGAYGQHNIGDDALLEVFLAQLAGEHVVVNSAQPEVTKARYGVDAVPTYLRVPRLARPRSVLASDLVIFGGGSLLKEIEGHAAARLAYFARVLGILGLCRLTGRKTAMIGVGMGPLNAGMYRTLSRIAANMTGLITVRDEPSRDLLREIGVRRPIEVTADPVFILGRVPAAAQPDANAGDQPTVAVIPRYSLTQPERAALAAACDELVARHGARIQMITFQTGFRPEFDDDACAKDVIALMRHGNHAERFVPERVNDAMTLVERAELVVSARLHGLIFAALAGRATVAVGYDMKVQSFMASIGRADACLSLKELVAGKLSPVVVRAWPNRMADGAATAALVDEMAERARRNFTLLQGFRRANSAAPAESTVPAATT